MLVLSLGGEDPLEKGMAIHSSILAWRILQTEKPGGVQSIGSQRVGHDSTTNTHAHTCVCVCFKPDFTLVFAIKTKTNIDYMSLI